MAAAMIAGTRLRTMTSIVDIRQMCSEPSELLEATIMKRLNIADDVYEYLIAAAHRREETVSDLLRRRLAIPRRGISNGGSRLPKTKTADLRGRKLVACLKRISIGQNVRRRFVQTLRCLYALNPTEFADRARNIQGRERKYFSEDREGMTR